MSQDPLDAIAGDGIADTLTYRETETADRLSIPTAAQDELSVGKAPPVPADLSEIRGALQAVRLRQHRVSAP